jgi:hypothetical protein
MNFAENPCHQYQLRYRKETVASRVHVNDPKFQEQSFVDLLGCKYNKEGFNNA